MAYSTSNPPRIIAHGIGDSNGRLWIYASTDASTVVDADGYFTDGYDLGMRASDIVMVIDTNASPVDLSIHVVNSASATGGVDLEDGTVVSGSDSD